MTQAQLAEAVAARTGLTGRQAAAAVDAALRTIRETVARGETVTLVGFGVFEVHAYPRSPADTAWTGRRPAFRPGVPFREAVQAGQLPQGEGGPSRA